jgi:hypothetical protein
MTTTADAPRGYIGAVTLTAAQRDSTQARTDRWTRVLIAQAQDDGDRETQANAQMLLRKRGIGWS